MNLRLTEPSVIRSARTCLALATLLALPLGTTALIPAAPGGAWRQLTETELESLIPATAQVEGEQIETELRTASGVKDDAGRVIAAVVLITAGYSAEGKYAHWFSTQATLQTGKLTLSPGEYAVGYRTGDSNTLLISFFKASSGRLVGAAQARKEAPAGPIRSIFLSAAGDESCTMQIGRYAVRLTVTD